MKFGYCKMCKARMHRLAGHVRGCAYFECPTCGFIYSYDAVRQMQEQISQNDPPDSPENGWATADFLDPAMKTLANQPLRILDFGAGESVVPKILRGQGHRVIEIDVLPPAKPHPDRLTGDLLSMRLDRRQFDLVYSFQVFEHLFEPRPLLVELLRLTRPGGLVLIHTDMETPEREGQFEQWPYVLPPDHCSLYRHETFRRFLWHRRDRIVHLEPKAVIIQKRSNNRRRTISG